jgi:hypothetical protein
MRSILIMPSRKEGKGIYASGSTASAFASLESFSPKASNIIQRHIDKVEAKLDSLDSGLRAQYEIQLRRLRERAPSLQLMGFPFFVGRPSECIVLESLLRLMPR